MRHPGNVPPQPPRPHERLALWLFVTLSMLPALACNAFAGNLLTPTPPVSSVTPAATAVPATASGEARLTVLVDLNVRAGPGVQYERLSFLPEGASAVITGRDAESDWWQIACPADVSGAAACWIAGGPQFVSAPDGAGVPVVEAPATPTPTAAGTAVDGWLAYVSAGQLNLAALDLAQDPPALAVSPLRLTEGAAVTDFQFSPDGRYIAYLSSGEQANTLHVVSLDGREPRQLVSSRALPMAPGRDSTRFAVLVDQMQWFPDSQALAFNTTLANLTGPGMQSQEDLWTVSLNGDLRELFAPGLGGGSFLLLDQEQALLGKTDALLQANLSDSSTEVTLSFERVNTASEYAYYPRPQRTAAGVYVALAPPDPWLDGALTSLWRVPAAGAAELQGQLRDVLLLEPVVWSGGADRLAFVQRAAPAGPQLPRLVLAAGTGEAAEPYTGGESLDFFAWSPGGGAFLYAGAGFFAQGQAGAPAQQVVLPAEQQAYTAVWLAEDSFLVSTGSAAEGRWHIRSSGSGGTEQSLVTLDGQAAPFAVWLAPP